MTLCLKNKCQITGVPTSWWPHINSSSSFCCSSQNENVNHRTQRRINVSSKWDHRWEIIGSGMDFVLTARPLRPKNEKRKTKKHLKLRFWMDIRFIGRNEPSVRDKMIRYSLILWKPLPKVWNYRFDMIARKSILQCRWNQNISINSWFN